MPAFAAPASAAVPGIAGDPVVNLSLSPSVTAGASVPGSITVDYTPAEGAEGETHVVAAEFAVTGSAGVVELTSAQAECDAATAYQVTCTDAAADANTAFAFDLAAVASADDEAFGYTLAVTIDGIEVASKSGTVGVESAYDVHNPYAHGDVTVTDIPGSTTGNYSVKFNPVVYQDFDLAPTAAAAVVTFTNPAPENGIDPTDLAWIFDRSDNCRTTYGEGTSRTGMVCVIADLPDVKGQFLTFTKDVDYLFDSRLVGPLDVCSCEYRIETIDAAALAEDYAWVPATGSMIGLTPTAAGWEGAEESIAYYSGDITLTTADNTYDLEVDEVTVDGMVGDTVTVSTEVENTGWAAATDLNPEGDGYLVRGQLPEGTELVRVDSDGEQSWDCHDAGELDEVYEATPGTLLERFDFACTVPDVWITGTEELTFTVKLTDTSAVDGAIEIGALYNDGEYEADPSSDFAVISTDITEARYDYNQDDYEDLLVVRKSDGALRLYKGTGDGVYASPVTVGTGWGGTDIVMAGDITGDGIPDVVARNNASGVLYTYPGNGSGGFGARITVGSGWGGMGQIAVGNFDGDGEPDLLATAYADGDMYFYPGLGNGKFGSRVLWGEWWDGMDVISSVGDADGDGYDEYLSRWNYNGYYYLYTSAGEVIELDQSLFDQDETRRFDQVVGVGDLSRDGWPDLVKVDLRTGELVRHTVYPDDPDYLWSTVIGSSGWGAMRLPVIQLDRTYDYDYDGFSDLFAQHKSTKDLFLYEGLGNRIGARWTICGGCDGITLVSAGGDYTSDGRIDLMYRAYTGALYIVPGLDNGEAGFDSEIHVGNGWNAMDVLSGGHDFTGDGKDDLVAREKSTGYLWMYPGKGNGTFGSRSKIGSSWNAMRDVSAVGDLDHDGHADVMSILSSTGCLYFYGGKGNGTLKAGVQISCGWGGFDQITGVGDYNRDGHVDWLARRKSDGALFLYPGNGKLGAGARIQIGSGWGSMILA
ncbi:hypothetical protein GCM10009830_23180 [Glycomyces endophyticus]|uniref:VCBS repeat-containing protein n=1 Tax=Glycomyces endophyticus TaxID=480996 RepID=A0ABP4SPB3_9ACTN